MSTEPFLRELIIALQTTLGETKISTQAFVLLCQQVIPVFDHLEGRGQVTGWSAQNESLENASMDFSALEDIVNADKQNGTVCQRGSYARNLHRLMSAITFIKTLIEELAKSPDVTLKDAASIAYELALAPIHTRFVRGIVSADESAKETAGEVMRLVDKLAVAVNALYDEPMPPSTTWTCWNLSRLMQHAPCVSIIIQSEDVLDNIRTIDLAM